MTTINSVNTSLNGQSGTGFFVGSDSVSTATGTILRSNGTTWHATTATFADTYAVSTVLYASSANTVVGLATANSSLLITDGSGVPSWGTTLPTAVVAAIPGRLSSIDIFTASGTWTKPSDFTTGSFVLIEVVGGGGGSGGVAATAAGQASESGGGGGGGYAIKKVSNASLGATETVTIGAAGTAGSAGNNAGGTGGTTSFGAIVSATGGAGGSGGASAVDAAVQGGAGGNGSGGDLNIPGGRGGSGNIRTSTVSFQSVGGASHYSSQPISFGAGSGTAGFVYGGGASGAASGASAAARAGSAGAAGLVIVYNYQ